MLLVVVVIELVVVDDDEISNVGDTTIALVEALGYLLKAEDVEANCVVELRNCNVTHFLARQTQSSKVDS